MTKRTSAKSTCPWKRRTTPTTATIAAMSQTNMETLRSGVGGGSTKLANGACHARRRPKRHGSAADAERDQRTPEPGPRDQHCDDQAEYQRRAVCLCDDADGEPGRGDERDRRSHGSVDPEVRTDVHVRTLWRGRPLNEVVRRSVEFEGWSSAPGAAVRQARGVEFRFRNGRTTTDEIITYGHVDVAAGAGVRAGRSG